MGGAKSRISGPCEQPLGDELFLFPTHVGWPSSIFSSHWKPNDCILKMPKVCVSGLIVKPQETWAYGEGVAIKELLPIFFGLCRAVVETSDRRGELRGKTVWPERGMCFLWPWLAALETHRRNKRVKPKQLAWGLLVFW